jgi:hypothetical protein
MIEYLLVLHVCSNIDGDCSWQTVGRYRSERACILRGLAADPLRSQFKCDLASAPELIPLPRPRPR